MPRRSGAGAFAMKTLPIRALPVSATMDAVASSTSCVPRWEARRLLEAPHRLGFFAGALMLGASALWWSVMLVLRHGLGIAVPWAVSPGLAHALWFAFGFMPLFFSGFLFTAGPKWLGLAPVPARVLLPPVLASLAGWVVFVMGVHRASAVAAIGLAAVAWGWLGFTRRFIALLRTSSVADRVHASIVAAACALGVVAIAAAAAALMAEREDLARAALQCGLWGFVGIVYVTVAHRMIPFFSASALPVLDAWRPMWLLWTFVALLVVQLPFALAELWVWPWPNPLRVVQIVIEAATAMLLLGLALRWGLVQSLRLRLLAMLHLGFLWLGIAFALAALSHTLLLASDGTQSLGLAAQHALTMGFFGSTLLAMATRVSCGHGGRTLAADGPAWALFLVLQSAVLLRVLAALWPTAEPALRIAASLAWLAAAGGWALRYGRWFGTPRVDGRPG
jgi:uncharacterized protein involved in response to NO